ncbi:MAG: PEP-CTERM sorting domain-containing protein [Phycisphaerales bacterium]|nr:PEP-CTERM sorting domain-containing protein [Phycisphaerales bacterium]
MKIATLYSSIVILSATSICTAGIELTSNGDFESGNLDGWESFPTGNSMFDLSNDSYSGNFAGEINNLATGSSAVIKQANLGVGVVSAFQDVTISFWAMGLGEVGGVSFAEFFSEIDGGGVSSSELLGGAPLFVSSEWQFYSFDTTTGADVSGGITLQFAAVTGANIDSTMQLFIDDVSVSIVPAPSSVALLGLGGMLSTRRRRA